MELNEILAKQDRYCARHIPSYKSRVKRAMGKMDYNHCPLRMADRELYEEMQNAIADWCDIHGTSYEFDLSDIDPELVLFPPLEVELDLNV